VTPCHHQRGRASWRPRFPTLLSPLDRRRPGPAHRPRSARRTAASVVTLRSTGSDTWLAYVAVGPVRIGGQGVLRGRGPGDRRAWRRLEAFPCSGSQGHDVGEVPSVAVDLPQPTSEGDRPLPVIGRRAGEAAASYDMKYGVRSRRVFPPRRRKKRSLPAREGSPGNRAVSAGADAVSPRARGLTATNMAKTSFTSVGNSANSRGPTV
jgi:hypothetical protein